MSGEPDETAVDPGPALDDTPAGAVVATRSRLQRPRAVLWLVAVPALFLLAFGADRVLSRHRVLRGVWLDGVALSGLSRPRAAVALGELDARLRSMPLRVRLGRRLINVDAEKLGFHLHEEPTLDAALAAGRSGGVAAELSWWVARFTAPRELVPRAKLDREAVRRLFDDWDRHAVEDPPFEGGVAVRDGALAPDYPRPGHAVDRNAARRAMTAMLVSTRRRVVEIPLTRKPAGLDRKAVDAAVARARELCSAPIALVDRSIADPITFDVPWLVEALRSRERAGELELHFDPARVQARLTGLQGRLEGKPLPARFTVDAHDHVAIVPSRTGTRLDPRKVADALVEAATGSARIGELPVERGAEPAFSTEDAVALHIKGLVSRFTTFHPCCRPRVRNIHRIADLLDGRIVRPGEIFSVNAVVGERTVKNGFVSAPSIEDGEMVDSVGGGVSQFATTFFNAVLRGGYDIVERQAHSYWFPRYPMGHEATLSWPKPDLIFENDSDAGVLIKTAYTEKSITVKVYGDNGGRKVTLKVSPRHDIVKPPIEYIADPSLDPDEQKIKVGGEIGWSVIAERVVVFPDGKKKDEKRKVTYKPRTRRLAVHPCKIPKGEPGYTGDKCPEPEEDEDAGVEAEAGAP